MLGDAETPPNAGSPTPHSMQDHHSPYKWGWWGSPDHSEPFRWILIFNGLSWNCDGFFNEKVVGQFMGGQVDTGG